MQTHSEYVFDILLVLIYNKVNEEAGSPKIWGDRTCLGTLRE